MPQESHTPWRYYIASEDQWILPECDEAGRYYSISKKTRWSRASRNSGLMGQLCGLVEGHIVVKMGFTGEFLGGVGKLVVISREAMWLLP